MSFKEKRKIDWGLKFYRNVLKLDNLHFGLWENDPLTIEGTKRAQERYTEKLINIIPDEVKSVLDVGCGTGITALKLKNRGYDIECVNPDSFQQEIFKKNVSEGIPFHNVEFESFKTQKRFNLILMSESSQYLNTEKMIENAKNILAPGGWLLIADYFRKQDTRYYRTCKVKDVFLEKIKSNGFELVNNENITRSVIPNLTMGKKIYSDYGLPVINLITEYLRTSFPFLTFFGSKIFSKKLKKISYYLFDHTPEKLDEKKFMENMEYLFLLFRRL